MAGQIIKRGDNKYLVRVYLGREAGKKKYHNKTINGSKKDAEKYLRKVLRERDLGEYIEPSKQLLSEYLDTWLETAVKIRVRDRTYRDYKEKVRLYIKPDLGNYNLQTLSPEHIQKLYNKMLDDGKSARTVRLTHAILKNALKQAVKWGKTNKNPADLVDLPRQERKEMKVLTPDQAAAFLDAAVFDTWKAFFSLMLSSGMRPSEALALKWSDVDFKKKRVTVCRSLTRTAGGGWELQEPKTSRSRRTIPLPGAVIEDLQELKQKQEKEAAERKRVIQWNLKGKETAEKYNEYGFVFAAENGEPMSDKNIYRRHFKPILRDAKLPEVRLYDLRHTCATLLLAAGENPKIVSERLGHASITLTLDTYSHVLPDMQQAAVEKLEILLFNNQKGVPHNV